MKRIILGSFVLTGLLFACAKPNVQDSPEMISADTTIKEVDPPGKLERSRNVQGNRVDCINPGFTCRVDKRVQPTDFVAVTAVSKATPATLSNVFSEFNAELVPYFSNEMIDAVINGEMRLEVSGLFEFGEKTYFSFYRGEDFIECAPLSK